MFFSEKPGKVCNYEHTIYMQDDKPFCAPACPIPFVYRDEVKKHINGMLKWDIIKAEVTHYVSPLVVVRKKDKSIRICLDARFLNERMAQDYGIPPNPHELLLRFKKGQVFSTIDLSSAFWQIPIKKEHKKYIGFMFDEISYTFNKVLFGLSTSMVSLT